MTRASSYLGREPTAVVRIQRHFDAVVYIEPFGVVARLGAVEKKAWEQKKKYIFMC